MVKKAIKLPSSKRILWHGNGDFEKHTLVSLLEDGWKHNLKSGDKIIITEEYLRHDLPEDVNPTISDLRYKKDTITYGELKRIYKNAFDREYSPETQEERSNFEIELMEKEAERRGAWGHYLSTMSYIHAVEKEQKREEEKKKVYDREGSEGVKKLKEKWNKEDSGHMLIIG